MVASSQKRESVYRYKRNGLEREKREEGKRNDKESENEKCYIVSVGERDRGLLRVRVRLFCYATDAFFWKRFYVKRALAKPE